MTRPNRTIEDITGELHAAFERKIANILTIGDLLAEARENLPCGCWLAWLKNEFSMSEHSARKCAQVARYGDWMAVVNRITAKAAVKPDLDQFLTDVVDDDGEEWIIVDDPSEHPPRTGRKRRKGGVT